MMPFRLEAFSLSHLALAVIAGSVLCLVVPAQGVERDEQIQFADGLFSRGLFDMAAAEYEKLLAENRSFEGADVATYRLAESYRELGKQADASQAYQDVVSRFPESTYRHRASYRRAELFVAGQRYEEAARLFSEGLKADPPREIAASSLYFLGTCRERLQQTDSAAAAFEQVVNEHPDSPFYGYACLALAQLALARDPTATEAVDLLEKAAGVTSAGRVPAEAVFLLGDVAFRRGDYKESAAAYAKLMDRFPGDPRAGEARLQAAWSYLLAGQYGPCLELAEGQDEPGAGEKGADWEYVAANALRLSGKREKALAAYERLGRDWPDHSRRNAADYERAMLLNEMGREDEAWALAARVQPEAAFHEDLLWLLAGLAERRGWKKQALEHLEDLHERFPATDQGALALFRTARMRQDDSLYEQAAAGYKRFLEAHAGHPLEADAWFGLAYCQARAGRPREAITSWGRAAEGHADHPLHEQALYQKGLAELQIGALDAAGTTLESYIAAYPESVRHAEASYWLGHVNEQQGKLDAAVREWKRTLKIVKDDALRNRVRLGLAGVLQRQGKEAQAADQIQPLLDTPMAGELDPSLLEWLARHQLEASKWEEAEAAAEVLVQGKRAAAWLELGWYLVGRAREERGSVEAAAQAYENAMAQPGTTRESVDAAYRRGLLALDQEDWSRAVACLDKAAERASTPDMIDLRARSYYGLGVAARAEQRWEDASRLFMSVGILFDDAELTPDALYHAAEAFARLGRKEDHARVIGELGKRYPESAWARQVGVDTEP